MKAAVIAALKDVASNAGDASGNADRAVSLMSHYKNVAEIDEIIATLCWALEQSRSTTCKTEVAIKKLQQFKEQGGAA